MSALLTVDEAAELLNVHKETIRRQIRKGALPAVKIGSVYRISRDDLTPTRTVQPQKPAPVETRLLRHAHYEWHRRAARAERPGPR